MRLGLLLLLVACEPPRRIVVEDRTDLVSQVIEVTTYLEDEAECILWAEIDVGGRKRDWRGRFPPHGTVTVEISPEKLKRGDGYAKWSLLRTRSRIYLEEDPADSVVAHELFHAIGVDHRGKCQAAKPAVWCADGLDGVTLQSLKDRCM